MPKTAPKHKRGSAESQAVRELLVRESPQAVAFLVQLMCDEEQKVELRMKAAESILDRACGKPSSSPASVGGGGTGGEISVRFEGELEEWSR